MEHKNRGKSAFQEPFSFISGLLQSVFFSFGDSIKGTTSYYLNLLNIKSENRELEFENQELKARLNLLNELKSENDRLRELLNFKTTSKMNLIAAKVIGRDPIVDHSTVTINRGTHHGLKAQMAVISTNGAVGYVFHPGLTTSQVLLITDRYAVLDATVQRTRARGIVEGKSKKNCRLKYLERGDDIKIGDLVVTSGLDQIFPQGFPIATISKIEKDPLGTSQNVDLTPIANPLQLEEVFVVLEAHFESAPPETELKKEIKKNEKENSQKIKKAELNKKKTQNPPKENEITE